MKRTRTNLNLTAERAAHALRILIADGKIAAKDVTDALKRREQMIRQLRQRLVALEQGSVSAIERSGRKVARTVERKTKRKMSTARRAALRLHGKYLGHIRTLPTAAKARVKKIRGTAGVHAAIRAAKTMAKPAAPGAGPKTRTNYQNPQERKLAAYRERERPRPDKHGGSGAGRQQGGSGAGRERG